MLHFQSNQNENALPHLENHNLTSGHLGTDRPSLGTARADTELPHLCPAGHVLVVTAYYPPTPGGSSIIMRNLLSRFHPTSYSVVTGRRSVRQAIEVAHDVQVYRIMSSVHRLSHRFDSLWLDWQLTSAVSRLVDLIERVKPDVMVGVYPSFHFLKIAREAARMTRVPWVAYLHDTIAESLSNTRWAAKAAELQEQVFAEAAAILVMSQGMADLYKKKYSLSCQPLEHTYPEPIPTRLPQAPAPRQAFWGGDIYNINAQSVGRVSEALRRTHCPFLIATKMTLKDLNNRGLRGGHIKTRFYPKRMAYLRALRQQGLLVLALDWPDESPTHQDELATIFPTKTPEYLVTGRPILVHCPASYFLARFFREHHCGLVVTERSVEALEEAVRQLLEDSPKASALGWSALAATQLFRADRLAQRFQITLQTAAASL